MTVNAIVLLSVISLGFLGLFFGIIPENWSRPVIDFLTSLWKELWKLVVREPSENGTPPSYSSRESAEPSPTPTENSEGYLEETSKSSFLPSDPEAMPSSFPPEILSSSPKEGDENGR